MTHNRWAAAAALLAGAVLLAGCNLSKSTFGFGPQPQAAPTAAEIEAARRAEALAPLFAQLRDLESGARTEPVRIVQIGDDLTANDEFSGRLRAQFQRRFGSAGRGLLPPGVPYEGYAPKLVTVQQSRGWRVADSATGDDSGLFGMSGYRLRGTSGRDVLTLTSTEPEGFDIASLNLLQQPRGGTLAVLIDGTPVHRLSTAGEITRAARLDVTVPPGAKQLELRPQGDGPVDLIGWTVERNHPGVIYENLGVVGATIDVMDAWDAPTVAWELAAREPALIVVTYGVNEALDASRANADYAARFAARLRLLTEAAPDAAILVVGPPDVERRSAACGSRETPQQCVPAGTAISGQGTTAAESCVWQPPVMLETIRAAERQAADEGGYYFWDWSAVMGGACGMHGWAVETPPLAEEDHRTPNTAGYFVSADALFDEIMAGYASYRGTPAGAPAAPAPEAPASEVPASGAPSAAAPAVPAPAAQTPAADAPAATPASAAPEAPAPVGTEGESVTADSAPAADDGAVQVRRAPSQFGIPNRVTLSETLRAQLERLGLARPSAAATQ